MREKKYSSKKLALMVVTAGLLALPVASIAATNVDLGSGGTVSYGGGADTLTIDAINGTAVHSDVMIEYATATSTYTSTGTAPVGVQYTDTTSEFQVRRVYTMTAIDMRFIRTKW